MNLSVPCFLPRGKWHVLWHQLMCPFHFAFIMLMLHFLSVFGQLREASSLSLLPEKRLEAWRLCSAFLHAYESPLWARSHITWIYVSVSKLVSPSESPWSIWVQALSHANAAACLCLCTQPAETGYFCFLCLHKSTRYILSDPRLRFARKNHGFEKQQIFFISFSIQKKAASQNTYACPA